MTTSIPAEELFTQERLFSVIPTVNKHIYSTSSVDNIGNSNVDSMRQIIFHRLVLTTDFYYTTYKQKLQQMLTKIYVNFGVDKNKALIYIESSRKLTVSKTAPPDYKEKLKNKLAVFILGKDGYIILSNKSMIL